MVFQTQEQLEEFLPFTEDELHRNPKPKNPQHTQNNSPPNITKKKQTSVTTRAHLKKNNGEADLSIKFTSST